MVCSACLVHRLPAYAMACAGLVAGTLLVRPARAAPLAECQTITESGEYELAGDVTAPALQICFSIRASDVTLDGMGHTITVDGAEAAEVAQYGDEPITHVTIRNLASNGGVRVYGDGVSQVLFERLVVDGITNGAGDDVTIQDNVVGQSGIVSSNNDREGWFGYRPQILRNQIRGGSTDVKILLEVIGGRVHPCPQLDALIQDNVVVSTRDDPPPEATAAVRIRCATHTVFTGNLVVSLGTTIGLYLRDESDDGRYEDNVFVSNTQETIRIASGNPDKTLPARNRFVRNVFRSEAGPVTFLQGIGPDNSFEHNCFWSQSTGRLNVSAGNHFDHNTFYVAGPDQAIHVLAYREDFTDHWTNNVFSYQGADVYGFDGFDFSRYAGDYNLFFNRTGAVAFGPFGASLAQWQANSAAAGFASDANSLEADPLLGSPADAGDLCLGAGSPALGAASDGSDLGASVCLCGAPDGVGGAGTGGGSAAGDPGTAGSGDSSDEGGCGCRLGDRSARASGWLLGGLLGLAYAHWRARRPRRARGRELR